MFPGFPEDVTLLRSLFPFPGASSALGAGRSVFRARGDRQERKWSAPSGAAQHPDGHFYLNLKAKLSPRWFLILSHSRNIG